MEDSSIEFIYHTIDQLYDCNCSQIPKERGVYVVDVPEGFSVEFTDATTAFDVINSKNMLYSPDELQDKYIKAEQRRLYIGKAGGRGGLRKRILCYVKYGKRERLNHRGGRAIWQIARSGNLLIGYHVCTSLEEPEALERKLLADYLLEHAVYPLANHRL